jgi:serine/threonine protein kinase
MLKRTLLLLSLSTAIGSTFASGSLPEIPWSELSIGRKLGQGGFGEVYAGRWKGLEVAVKRLSLGTLTGDLKADFDRETQAMWRCQFTNVLRLLGVCKEDDHYAMVVELMRQGSLYESLHSGGGSTLTEKERWDIAIRIAQGLDDLHKRGVIHGDLKSHNILLDEHGRARISDFGLAKIKTTTSTAITHSQGGSVRWSAPECFDDEPRITDRSDIYSYGMILWELLTADIPFKQFTREPIIVTKVHSGLREKIPVNCSPIWRELIESCWQQDPTLRPSAETILRRLSATRPPVSRSVWLPEETPEASNHASGYQRFPAAKGDWEKAVKYYQRNPVPGYDVGKVEVIWDPSSNEEFKSRMKKLQQRRGNPRYVADWSTKTDATWRTDLNRGLAPLADPFSSYEAEDSPDVKLMPLWHGTQEEKLPSLLSAGYTAFGETDEGYFGKGVYTTPDAAYAQLYANGFNPVQQPNARLILNWVVSYNALPIIREDYDRSHQRLTAPVEAFNDARYIPVVQGALGSAEYIPTQPGESFQYREFMTQNGAQVLPRYVIVLSPSAGRGHQIGLMFTALHEKLRAEETEIRRKLKDHLNAVYRSDPELSRIKTAEGVERAALEQGLTTQRAQLNQAVVAVNTLALPLRISSGVVIPEIALGYEEAYLHFLRGKLIYNPDPKSDAGKVEFPIAALANPLGTSFDLRTCRDSGKYLSIATGYRQGKNTENANKVEVWIVPRFLIERELATTAGHFRAIIDKWPRTEPLGIIFTWGGWSDLDKYDYNVVRKKFGDNMCAAYASSSRLFARDIHLDRQYNTICLTELPHRVGDGLLNGLPHPKWKISL